MHARGAARACPRLARGGMPGPALGSDAREMRRSGCTDWCVPWRKGRAGRGARMAAMRGAGAAPPCATDWLAAQSSCSSRAASSSLNNSERVRKRRPVGPSSENMPPEPGTASITSRVCCQYSNCARVM